MIRQRDRTPYGDRVSARRILQVGVLCCLGVGLLDWALTGRLSQFFDLCFITLCLALGRLARREASYAAAFVPPAVLVTALTVLALLDRDLVGEAGAGLGSAVLAGLAAHAAALGVGYALCLAALGIRLRTPAPVSPRTG